MSEFNNQCCNDSTKLHLKRWYVVYSKPRQEGVARENLARQGYETYLPQLRVTRRKQGALVNTIEPFFPRYLFIRLDKTQDNWAPIRSTRGVSSLVRFQGSPTPVPQQLIDALLENENNEQLQMVARKSWKKGDTVEIEQGPFAGYSCIFQETRGADRASVLLNIIGKPTRATLNKDDLQLPQFA